MEERTRKIPGIRKLRLHNEGRYTLVWGAFYIIVFHLMLYYVLHHNELTLVPLYCTLVPCLIIYGCLVNFFRCPIRRFEQETQGVVVAPADGHVVVVEEVDENEYFHDRRIQVSIFMSPFNVHANWIPVDGKVTLVRHHNGNFLKAWLPKASIENERSTVVIRTPEGVEILTRQIAGAMARRIVTYLEEGQDYEIDEHLGFIKLGSRVDVYLPLGTEIKVKVGQATVGNSTVIAKLK